MENHENLETPSHDWIVIKDPDTRDQMFWRRLKNRGGAWMPHVMDATRYASRTAAIHVWVYARQRFPKIYHMAIGVVDDFQ